MSRELLEQSRDPKDPDQNVVKPEEKLEISCMKLPKGSPLPGVDGTGAWEFTYNLQEIRDLIK